MVDVERPAWPTPTAWPSPEARPGPVDAPAIEETAPGDRITLTVIGASPAWALRPDRPSSCYLVELDGEAIALDMGQGSFGGIAAVRPPESLRAIVISHLHPDHHVDLVAMRHYLQFGLERPASVELHAPPELRARYDAFLGEPDFLANLPGDDLEPGTRQLGLLSVEARRVTHALNSFAFRVASAQYEDGPGLVYSGDCGRWEDLLVLIRPGDTLLSEAFWGTATADPGAEHLTARDAARAASKGRASRLILTHIAEANDPVAAAEQARSGFGGPVALAEPGMRLGIA